MFLSQYGEYEIKLCKNVDLKKEIASCKKFITDYSSVLWDATYLNKKALLLCSVAVTCTSPLD